MLCYVHGKIDVTNQTYYKVIGFNVADTLVEQKISQVAHQRQLPIVLVTGYLS